VARLLQADSAILAHDGRINDALDDCRAMIGVGRSIGDEPFYISQLVRVAILNSALLAAERVLNQGEASDDAMASLQALILEEADQPIALIGLRGERAVMDDVFAKLTTGQVTIKQMSSMGANAQSTPTEILASISTAFVRHNHAIALKRMTKAVEIARRPLAEQPDLWDEWEKQSTTSDGLMTQVASALSREAVPGLNSFSNACIRSRAHCFAMILLIAAERHRLAHGSFPATLDAIDPRFVPRAFIDPYAGRPMNFKPDGEGGVVVYSISIDRSDDGGKKLGLKTWTQKGFDLGFHLNSVANRARPPKLDTLPEDVFVQDSDEADDIP